MPLSKDPTRTASIERRWNREIKTRWKLFEVQVFKALRKSGRVINAFDMDGEQIRIFMVYWQDKANELLLGSAHTNWQSKYQLQSYERSIARGREQLIAQGARLVPTAHEIQQAQGISFASGATSVPVHAEALDFLYIRSYEALKQWTDNMTREVRMILTDGVNSGKGIVELRKQIKERLLVSEGRAQVIARTETIQAYQRATINQTELLSFELKEDIKLRWVTVTDGRVRHQHAFWHGKIMTTKEAFKNIQVSPFNCRCAQIEVIKEADTEKKQIMYDKERKHLLTIENLTNQ